MLKLRQKSRMSKNPTIAKTKCFHRMALSQSLPVIQRWMGMSTQDISNQDSGKCLLFPVVLITFNSHTNSVITFMQVLWCRVLLFLVPTFLVLKTVCMNTVYLVIVIVHYPSIFPSRMYCKLNPLLPSVLFFFFFDVCRSVHVSVESSWSQSYTKGSMSQHFPIPQFLESFYSLFPDVPWISNGVIEMSKSGLSTEYLSALIKDSLLTFTHHKTLRAAPVYVYNHIHLKSSLTTWPCNRITVVGCFVLQGLWIFHSYAFEQSYTTRYVFPLLGRSTCPVSEQLVLTAVYNCEDDNFVEGLFIRKHMIFSS